MHFQQNYIHAKFGKVEVIISYAVRGAICIGNRTYVFVTLANNNFLLLEGTRMWRRGADSDGYVANFVETEQIMHLNGFTSSFVQVKLYSYAYVIKI